jgi:type II secretory pathway component PulF
MANADAQNVTQLEIGLSREDQARIDELRKVNLEGKDDSALVAGVKSLANINEYLVGLTRVRLQDKVTFFQLLAVMINAGVPIIRSLYVLADQTKNLRLARVIRDLGKRMEEGSSLSVAMAVHERVFTESERGMIASGEMSGNLNEILHDIARQAEKGAMILAKVKGALIYPASIILIMIGAVVVMLTVVVPKLSVLFESSSQQLPAATRMLIWMSEVAQNSWYFVALAAAGAAVGLYFFRRSKKGRYTLDQVLLYIPIFGSLVRQLMISRFARMLASLMDAGLPIVKALEINANAVGNEVYKQRIMFASQDVAQGIPLGENLTANEFLFPPMVANMILVGEQTANVSEVAKKIAEHYESKVDNMVDSLSKLMEPVILVVMGLVVGFVVAAVMQPIMALSDLSSVI